MNELNPRSVTVAQKAIDLLKTQSIIPIVDYHNDSCTTSNTHS